MKKWGEFCKYNNKFFDAVINKREKSIKLYSTNEDVGFTKTEFYEYTAMLEKKLILVKHRKYMK